MQHRGVHPDRPIPPIPSNLLQFSAPAADLLAEAAPQTAALVRTAAVTKVPPKPKKRLRREPPKPLSGLDIDSILAGGGKKTALSPENAVPEFKQMLETVQNDDEVAAAVAQMGAIVRSLISEGFGGNTDDRVIEHLGTIRDEMMHMDQPHLYNDFLRALKPDLMSGSLGGDRRELWFRIIKIAKLGLIRHDQAESSSVTVQEAAEVSQSPSCNYQSRRHC